MEEIYCDGSCPHYKSESKDGGRGCMYKRSYDTRAKIERVNLNEECKNPDAFLIKRPVINVEEGEFPVFNRVEIEAGELCQLD